MIAHNSFFKELWFYVGPPFKSTMFLGVYHVYDDSVDKHVYCVIIDRLRRCTRVAFSGQRANIGSISRIYLPQCL